MSTDSLELRYRRLLRGYPQAWRERREDEVLAVLMEGAREEGRAHPTRAEAWDLARHALAHRLDELVSPASRQRTAALALVSVSALALVSLVLGELVPAIGPLVAPGQIESHADFPRLPPSPGTGSVHYLMVLAAFALVANRRSAAARGLLLGSAVLALSSPLIASHTGTLEPPLYFRGVLTLFLLVAAGAPIQLSGRSTRRAVGATVVVALGLGLMTRPLQSLVFGEPGYAYYRVSGLGLVRMGQVLLWASAPTLLVVLVLALRRRYRAWVGPALVVGVPWTLFALLAGLGNTAWQGARAAAFLTCGAMLVGVVFTVGRQVGRRSAADRIGSPAP